MGRPTIVDPGEGGGGGGGAGISVPGAGVVIAPPLELVVQYGVEVAAYPEQRRLVLSAPRAPRVAYKGADETFTTTALADVASLSFSIEAGATYGFRFHIPYLTSNVSEAIILAINGPASPTYVSYFPRVYTSAAVLTEYPRSGYDSGSAGTSGSTTEKSAIVEGSVENGANAGNLVLRAATETGAGQTATVRRGAFGLIWKLS